MFPLDEGIKLVQEQNRYKQKYSSLLPSARCRPPLRTSEAALVIERHAIERTAREMLRDMFIYTIFMVSVILVTYGHMDIRTQFLQSQYVKNKFLKTPVLNDDEIEVVSVDKMWNYLKTVVAPEIIRKKETTSTEYDIHVVGTARIRQVRSKDDTSKCVKFCGYDLQCYMWQKL
ncbi:unnamed protein product [Candidula unifasciata]|uniref:Uncharacterized protein n=1 Tax=Candidula unifasciata TaxID=100452 RepID=A0A8S3Z5F0_9EUPU|nr:unnamed protein product [Candidula unifasciata]